MGFQAEESARAVVEHYKLPITWQEFAALSMEMTKTVMGTAKLLPGNYEKDVNNINVLFFFF